MPELTEISRECETAFNVVFDHVKAKGIPIDPLDAPHRWRLNDIEVSTMSHSPAGPFYTIEYHPTGPERGFVAYKRPEKDEGSFGYMGRMDVRTGSHTMLLGLAAHVKKVQAGQEKPDADTEVSSEIRKVPMLIALGTKVEIGYTNWRGETRNRVIVPRCLWYGASKYHRRAQWLLLAEDTETGQDREFALADMIPVGNQSSPGDASPQS